MEAVTLWQFVAFTKLQLFQIGFHPMVILQKTRFVYSVQTKHEMNIYFLNGVYNNVRL
jgi:hypothetical protein